MDEELETERKAPFDAIYRVLDISDNTVVFSSQNSEEAEQFVKKSKHPENYFADFLQCGWYEDEDIGLNMVCHFARTNLPRA